MLRWLNTVFFKWKICELEAFFGQVLLVQKQKASNLCKTTSKEFEFLNKSYATAVAMATMTFQYGGYFGFKVIYLENDIGDPQILIHKMVCLSILNYVGE